MGFVLEQLERREAAALVRVEEARADALTAADRLDAARIELSNLLIARLTLAGLEVDSVEGAQAELVVVSGGGPRPGVRGAVLDEAL